MTAMPANSARVPPPGVILAGGRSSRMGGGDKTLFDLGGRPLLAHVIARLRPQVSHLALNANGAASRFDAFGVEVIADAAADFPGPLAGILAAMRWAHRSVPGASHVFTVPGDTPFLPLDLAARLEAAIAVRPGAIAVAAFQGQPNPVVGLWPVSLAEALEADMQAGARSVIAWCRQREAVFAEIPASECAGRSVDPFFNTNTPLDLAEARLLLQRERFACPVIGVAGWKNSGKTTLVIRLVQELTKRGYRISTIKFSHHEGDDTRAPDARVRDTALHAAAGALQVAFASPQRWAIVEGGVTPVAWHEATPDRSAMLDALVGTMAPADLILVEGYKAAAIPKIEVRRSAQPDRRELADNDSYVFAVVADHPVADTSQWTAHAGNIEAIADVLQHVAGLGARP